MEKKGGEEILFYVRRKKFCRKKKFRLGPSDIFYSENFSLGKSTQPPFTIQSKSKVFFLRHLKNFLLLRPRRSSAFSPSAPTMKVLSCYFLFFTFLFVLLFLNAFFLYVLVSFSSQSLSLQCYFLFLIS